MKDQHQAVIVLLPCYKVKHPRLSSALVLTPALIPMAAGVLSDLRPFSSICDLQDVFGGQRGPVADALNLNAGVALAAAKVRLQLEHLHDQTPASCAMLPARPPMTRPSAAARITR